MQLLQNHSWAGEIDPDVILPDIKIENTEPELYNSSEFHQNWRTQRYFSSTDTEEEMTSYREQNVGVPDRVDEQQLKAAHKENKLLLRDKDIKQEIHRDQPQ